MNTLIAIFMWIATGLFICYKRDWFKDTVDPEGLCTWTIITAPFSLVMSFIKVYLLGDWDAARGIDDYCNCHKSFEPDFDDDEND